MIKVTNNIFKKEFDIKMLSTATTTSSSTTETFEIDTKDASELLLYIDAREAAGDCTIEFQAGTGVCGKKISLTADQNQCSLMFISTGEIADNKGKARFTLTSSAALSGQNIRFGVIKKQFVKNN